MIVLAVIVSADSETASAWMCWPCGTLEASSCCWALICCCCWVARSCSSLSVMSRRGAESCNTHRVRVHLHRMLLVQVLDLSLYRMQKLKSIWSELKSLTPFSRHLSTEAFSWFLFISWSAALDPPAHKTQIVLMLFYILVRLVGRRYGWLMPPLQPRLKYLNKIWRDHGEMWNRRCSED